MSCKLISFDVSVCSTGYAVYEDGILVNYGNFVHREPKKDHLALMTNDIFCLLETEKPQIIVVEDVPYMNNINTFKKLERLIARIEAWAYVRDDITYAEYKPTQWRKLVASDGEIIPSKRAEAKAWAIKKTGIDQDDTAEAVLIGRAYINEWS